MREELLMVVKIEMVVKSVKVKKVEMSGAKEQAVNLETLKKQRFEEKVQLLLLEKVV